ncbi:MAG: hypothetical protein SFV52_14735 [Saprospiraceae bacterium]|nr:hypothetical protein [Saprospiraceae bacterium]
MFLQWSAPRAMQAFQVLRVGAILLTSVLLAKTGLSTSAIGVYEVMLYVGATLSFFWVNGLLQGIPPVHALCADDAEQERLLTLAFGVFNALSLVVTGGLFLFSAWLVPALTGLAELPFLGWFCLFLGFNLPAFVAEYVYLLRGQATRLVYWGLLSFGAQVLAVIAPVMAGYGLEGGLMALAGLAFVRWLWTLTLVFPKRGFMPWDAALLHRYLSFSSPLVLNVVTGNLVLLFDNWLVGYYYQSEAVFAVFRYGSRELPLATALATGLSVAMVGRLAAQPAQGMAELRVRGQRLMHAVFPPTLVLLFVSEQLFPLVFNPGFAESATLFNIYLLLTASRVLLPNVVVMALGRPGIILGVGLLELTAKVLLGWFFLQAWGLTGLAWSAVVAYFVEKIGLICWLEWRGIRTGTWLNIPVYAAYAGALALAYAISLLW